jgi:hypothetical protein
MHSATNTNARIHRAAVRVAVVDFYVYLAFLGGVAVIVEWA